MIRNTPNTCGEIIFVQDIVDGWIQEDAVAFLLSFLSVLLLFDLSPSFRSVAEEVEEPEEDIRSVTFPN